MKKDKHITEVKFYKYNEDHATDLCKVFAVFPEEDYHHYSSSTKVCYEHVGQHGSCDLDCLDEIAVLATMDEWQLLYDELMGLGYNLKVLNGWK